MTKHIILGILIVFMIVPSKGQSVFHKAYNPANGGGVDVTSDGGYVLTGTAKQTDSNAAGGMLVKLDVLGEIEWSTIYDTGSSFHEVRQTYDGGYILGGITTNYGLGGLDFYVVKTDALGNKSWSVTYGGAFWDHLFFVEQLPDSGYIFGGWVQQEVGPALANAVIVRLDKTGDTLWHKVMDYQIGGLDFNGFVNATITDDGGVMLAGATVFSFMAITSQGWLLKLDNSGNVEWTRTYIDTGAVMTQFGEVRQTADGGYVAVGYTTLSASSGQEILIVKTDSIGIVTWSKTYGSAGDDGAIHMILEDNEDITVFGYTDSYGKGSKDFLLMKTDANGGFKWAKTFGNCKSENFGAYYNMGELAKCNDNGYIFTGPSASFNGAYLVKTDSLGNINESCYTSSPVLSEANATLLSDSALFIYQNGLVTFPNPPTFNLKLSSTDIQCFQDTADFSWVKNIPCDGDVTNFSRIYTSHTGFPTDFAWTFDDPSSGANNISILEYPTHVFSAVDTYNVELIIDWECESDTVYHQIMVAPLYSVSTQDSICSGDSILLGGSYQTAGGTYFDTLFSVYGCDSIITTDLNIMVTPTANILNNDTIICKGDSVQLLGSGGGKYIWSPSIELNNDTVSNPMSFPGNSTTYLLTTILGLCSDNDSVRINVDFPPTLTINNDTTICTGNNINLQASGGSTYIWNPNTDLDNANISNPLASPESNTNYTVIASNQCGNDTGTVNVDVIVCEIFVPNAFTPNGDGINDVFQIKGEGVSQFLLIVYDRWGNKVFESKDINEQWLGINNNEGVYVYRLEISFLNANSFVQKGNVTLIR